MTDTAHTPMESPATPEHPIIDVATHLADADEALWRPYFTTREADLVPRVVDHQGVGQADSLEEYTVYLRALNVSRAFLLPGRVGLAALDHPDERAHRILARAHNDLVRDLCQQAGNLEFVPVVLPDDPDWSLAELRRWVASGPVRAVITHPTAFGARRYRDGTKHPLLRYLVDEGIVLMLHGETEQMVSLADLMGSGALDDGLKAAVVEAGCGWLPWFADRLRDGFDSTVGLPRPERDVDDLIHRQLLLTVQPTDPDLEAVLGRFGDTLPAFGSGFPHRHAAEPDAIRSLPARLGNGPAERILAGNAESFFFRGAA